MMPVISGLYPSVFATPFRSYGGVYGVPLNTMRNINVEPYRTNITTTLATTRAV